MFNFIKKLPSNYKNPKLYWEKRHKKYGLDLRGVGHCGMSPEKNYEEYLKAKEALLHLLDLEKINVKDSKILEIGCGIGLFTKVMEEVGAQKYTGVDIAKNAIKRVKKKFPMFNFAQLDITKTKPTEEFDLILMIDVTQHIVDEHLFEIAMKNITQTLKPNGIFIVTSWLTPTREKNRFYEVKRPIESYKKIFKDYQFSSPLNFRNKYVFSIRKPI